MASADFLVDHVEADGLVIGRNCGDDVPIGTVFTFMAIVEVDQGLCSRDLNLSAGLRLVLTEVSWYRHSVDAIPGGHTAGLRLEGEGLGRIRDALRTKRENENIHLRS